MESMPFAVQIGRRNDGQPTLSILKTRCSDTLFRWCGETARRVIAWAGLRDGQVLDKHRVRELAVVGAAAQQSIDSERRGRVEQIIQSRRGEHLSEDELVALCLSECPGLADDAVIRQLRTLADTGAVQRIVVDDDAVFYDADTSDHLHVYDPVTKTLHDAPQAGIVFARPAAHS